MVQYGDAVRCQAVVPRSDIGKEERAAVYAFLLCPLRQPSAPRRRQSARLRTSTLPLGRLPQDVILHIAQLAYEPRYVAEFELERDKLWFAPGTLSRYADCPLSGLAITAVQFDRASVLDRVTLLRPIVNCLVYVELTASMVWYGTSFACKFGKTVLRLTLDDQTEDDLRHISLGIDHDEHIYLVPSLDDSWTWCEDPLTVGLLVDTIRGCVTCRVNGRDGPCVRLNGSDWKRTGVTVRISDFPSDEIPNLPFEVSVSSPPCPKSLMRAAAYPTSLIDLALDGVLVPFENEHQNFTSDEEVADY